MERYTLPFKPRSVDAHESHQIISDTGETLTSESRADQSHFSSSSHITEEMSMGAVTPTSTARRARRESTAFSVARTRPATPVGPRFDAGKPDIVAAGSIIPEASSQDEAAKTDDESLSDRDDAMSTDDEGELYLSAPAEYRPSVLSRMDSACSASQEYIRDAAEPQAPLVIWNASHAWCVALMQRGMPERVQEIFLEALFPLLKKHFKKAVLRNFEAFIAKKPLKEHAAIREQFASILMKASGWELLEEYFRVQRSVAEKETRETLTVWIDALKEDMDRLSIPFEEKSLKEICKGVLDKMSPSPERPVKRTTQALIDQTSIHTKRIPIISTDVLVDMCCWHETKRMSARVRAYKRPLSLS